jgi:two-component system, OmpR family, response regulator
VTFLHAAHLFADGETTLPRFRHIGDLTLDLMHHDGRVEDRWLGLDPDEFALVWRLARHPGQCLPPETAAPGHGRDGQNGNLRARLFAKLAGHGLSDILIHQPGGCACSGALMV